MNGLIILIPVLVFAYYILYKFILESKGSYLLYLIFIGLFIIGIGFVMNFSKRAFYMLESAGIIFLMIIFMTTILHEDVLEKIKEYFKQLW